MNTRSDRVKIIETAEKHVKSGRFREAISEYEKLIEGDVQDIHISNIIGDLYVRLGQEERAVGTFQNVAANFIKRGMYSQVIAIFKKIVKINPRDMETALKLAELYGIQGFLSEARTEYLKATEILDKNKDIDKLIFIHEKLAILDKEDHPSRLTLAELYLKQGLTDKAVEKINEVAESMIENNELKKAGELLQRARELKKIDVRTVTNMVEIFRKEDKRKEALTFLQATLRESRDNLDLLNLMANLHFEDQNFEKAGKLYEKILTERPLDVNSRVRLGKIRIQEGQLDETFQIFEPLVASLLKKQRMEKAIGLLGLILSGEKVHLPTLEKLASIYKSKDQKKNLEITCRVMLKELGKKKLKDKMLPVLRELVDLCPGDEELLKSYKELRKEMGFLYEEKEEAQREKPVFLPGESEEEIRVILSKADLYLSQGLVKNAKRILENLALTYPGHPRIEQKLALLNETQAPVEEDKIPILVEKVSKKEARIEGRYSNTLRRSSSPQKEVMDEDKLTAADLFAETDIIPMTSIEIGKREFFDLAEKIEEELMMIEAAFYQQQKGKTAIMEKDLSDIVSEFKRIMEEKVDKDDYESRYNLGLAFLEQGLIEEAIEEFKLAAEDSERTADCYGLIAFSYRKKKDLLEAASWIEKGLGLVPRGSYQYLALMYDLACILEEMGEEEKALQSYREIRELNADFRDVAEKVERISKTLS